MFAVPFDANDPVNTPRGLNTDSPTVRAALADSVKELRDQGIPLDARLREYQYEMRGKERIPIHGGPGTLGVFNAISAPFKAREGFPDIVHGSSFVMAAHLNGTRCPDSRSILTYSLSANPDSPHYADQTRLFSRKRWVDMRFCVEEILRDRRLAVLELGCVRDSGLRSARVRRARGRRVRLAFRRRLRVPVKVEVFRASAGRLKRVAATRRSKSFTLKRRLRGGVYVARFTAPGVTAKDDRRDVVFRMRRRPRLDRQAVDLTTRGLRHDPLRGAALAAVPGLAPRHVQAVAPGAGVGGDPARQEGGRAAAHPHARRGHAPASGCGRSRRAPTRSGSSPARGRAGQSCGSPLAASSRCAISAAPSAIRSSASGRSSGSSRLARRRPSSPSTRGTWA